MINIINYRGSLKKSLSTQALISDDMLKEAIDGDIDLVLYSHTVWIRRPSDDESTKRIHARVNLSRQQVLTAMVYDALRLSSLPCEIYEDESFDDLVSKIIGVVDSITQADGDQEASVETRDEAIALVRARYMKRWINAESGIKTLNRIILGGMLKGREE